MSDAAALRDTQRRVGQTEVGERTMTLLPFAARDGVVSPFSANGNPFVAPIWRDCTPARLAMSVYCTPNNGANYWSITLYIIGPAGFAFSQGSVTTSALAAGQWLPLALTTCVTARGVASAFSVAYLSIAKVGAPGTIEIAPALYVL